MCTCKPLILHVYFIILLTVLEARQWYQISVFCLYSGYALCEVELYTSLLCGLVFIHLGEGANYVAPLKIC